MEEKNYLKQLPFLNISLSKSIVSKQNGKEINFYYQVLTTFSNTETFTTEHRYFNFLELERQIRSQYSQKNYPLICDQVPKINRINSEDYSGLNNAFISARRESLENYLNEFSKKPAFINHFVLDFLGIPEPHRMPFLNYFDFITNNQVIKKKKPADNIEFHYLVDVDSAALEGIAPRIPVYKMGSIELQDPSFIIKFEIFEKSHFGDRYEYVFSIIDKSDDKPSWLLRKSYAEFKNFTDKLVSRIGSDTDLFLKLVPSPLKQSETSDPVFLNRRKDGLQQYMDEILSNKYVYCDVLFEFLEYDFLRRTPLCLLSTPKTSYTAERRLTQDLVRKSILETKGYSNLNGVPFVLADVGNNRAKEFAINGNFYLIT